MNDSARLNRQTDEGVSLPVHLAPDASLAAAEPVAVRTSRAAQARRAEAFRRLVGASLDRAYSRATVLLADRFEAEDAVHDAAERAWRAWSSLRDPDRFEPWFGRILVNVCRDRLRRRRRVTEIELDLSTHDPVDAAAGQQLGRALERDALVKALSALSVDERIAVLLRYDGDLTVPEIARLTGARDGTVKSRLHNALRKLRERLQPVEVEQ